MEGIATDQIQEALAKNFGFTSFKGRQLPIIKSVLNNTDTVVIMPTGGGKSICYQIPALMMQGIGIVISPLIALMKDQVSGLQLNGIQAAFINSSQSRHEQLEIEQNCLRGQIKLLYVSPEKLQNAYFQDFLRSLHISLFAIDEAHCISFWGHDFRPEYGQLRVLKERYPDTPIVALTATADRLTRQDIVKQLGLQEHKLFISSFDRPNLSLEVEEGRNRVNKIAKFLSQRRHQSGIIYCLSRKSTESLAQKLRDRGFNAAHYHARLPSNQRDQVQDDFLKDNIQIICATIAFGMGIDKSNVRFLEPFCGVFFLYSDELEESIKSSVLAELVFFLRVFFVGFFQKQISSYPAFDMMIDNVGAVGICYVVVEQTCQVGAIQILVIYSCYGFALACRSAKITTTHSHTNEKKTKKGCLIG